MENKDINKHRRKKQPERVRSQLLKATGDIILKRGVASLTLDAVARKSDVSKGGLLHHFPSKQELLNGLFDDVLEKLKHRIDVNMQNDTNPHARFTRAYLSMNNSIERNSQGQLFMILTLAMMTNTTLRKRWLGWFEVQLNKAGSGERETICWIIRFASDGLWLSDLTQTPKLDEKQRLAVFEKLLEMTL